MIPDPLGFVADALQRGGALTELDDGGRAIDAMLPSKLAVDLALPETVRLAAHASEPAESDAPTIACGLGTPVLEVLVARAREQIPVTCVGTREPVRRDRARALAERLVLRNGVSTVRDAIHSEGTYLDAWLAWTAEADDRFEGVVRCIVDALDGGEPDTDFTDRVGECDATRGRPTIGDLGTLARRGADRLAHRVPKLVGARIEPLREAVARRHERDHQRIATYFAGLAAEAASARRRVDPAALAAKLEHFARERDGKLAELRDRYALRVTLRLAAARWILAPRATVSIRARRRKAERELAVHLPGGATTLDAIACDGCGGTTRVPALCDDRLHVLCEACAPTVQGRLRCRACGSQE